MMLRTTITRIRKVYSLGFVPRILRDDFCNGPATYTVIRKAHKSKKSTDDGSGPTENGPHFPILKPTSIDTTSGIPLTHRERCQRIIDQAFGTGPAKTDTASNEQYCSHTVNIENTRREMQEAENERIKLLEQKMKLENPMIADDRQCGIFKMSRELIKVTNDEDDIIVEDNTVKKTQKEAAPQMLAVNKELVKIFDNAPAKEKIDLTKDSVTKIQSSTEPLNANLGCAKLDHKLNISNTVISDTVGNKSEVYDDDDADARAPAVKPNCKWVLNVTTAKEKEEKLTQKLETIEETPLVEAQRPGIEGFNVDPKVLGDGLNPALTCKSIHKKQGNPQERYRIKKIKTKIETKKIDTKSVESEDKVEESENMITTSPSLIHHHMCSQVRLPDLNEQAEEIKILHKSDEIKPVKEDGIRNPDQLCVDPKVLGDGLNPASTCKSIHKKQGNPQERDLPGTYDEVAQRCLNQPLSQIDKILADEMEKMGLPLTCDHTYKISSTLMTDQSLVEMDLYDENKQEKHQKKDTQSVESEDKVEESDPKVLGDGLNPALTCKSIHTEQGNPQERDLPGTYDEVAQRCLNQPLSQIDKILADEMEKMDLPLTGDPTNKISSTLMTDQSLVEMDLYDENKQEKHQKIETKSDTEIQSSTEPLNANLGCAKVDHKLNISNTGISDAVGNKSELYDDNADADADARAPAVEPHCKRVLNVTTAKEKEEKLTQKLETIEETPLVEAQKPGIEGFNVDQKVLGDELSPALTCKSIHKKQGNPQERDLPGTYDEVAQRCLNEPLSQIDKILADEMEKMGLPLTCDATDKISSTLMADQSLVQMDLCNENKQEKHQKIDTKSVESEDKVEESENMITSPSLIHHHMCSQVRLPDLNEQAEEIKILHKSDEIKPVKEDGIRNPDQIKKKIKPVPCSNNSTAKLSCRRTSELDKYEDEMEIEPEKVPMDQTIQKDIIHKHGQPQFGYLQPNVKIPAPTVMPSDKESMRSLHSSIFKQLTGKDSPGLNVKKNAVKPAINPTSASSCHTVSHASGNIGAEGLFKPEYNSNYKVVGRPSHYGTINASDFAEHDQRLLAEREVENKNSHSSYLASTYAWGPDKEPSTTKVKNENEFYFNQSGEIECHSRTPECKPKTMEEQAVLNETGDAANRLIETVPLNKLQSDNSECKLNLEPEKATLPEELMKEHELDPYYVLTCNETCPISPGSYMSTFRNSDFVDTTETIYMKKNICESLRPKPMRDSLIVPFENVTAGRPKVDVKSLMSQYENLTADTKSQVCDNVSESLQPKLDGTHTTHLVNPQCENKPADRQVQLQNISAVDFELIPDTTPEIKELPKIKPTVVTPEHPHRSQQVSLTDLLMRVRERNRMQCASDPGVKVYPTEGKCRRKAPRCVPTAPRSTPNKPIPPPSFGLPMVKRRPQVCGPKRKGGGSSKKCTACDLDVTCGLQIREIWPEIACELDEAEACAAIARVDLTELVLEHIQTLGKMADGILRQVRSNAETLLTKDYDPWAPIPSWPIPKREKNPCDKRCDYTPGISGNPPCVRGCPVFPKVRATVDTPPPCKLKPCEGFPKRRAFSALDCFAVFIGNKKVYDL